MLKNYHIYEINAKKLLRHTVLIQKYFFAIMYTYWFLGDDENTRTVNLSSQGPVAQWIRGLTSDQKIAGSSPARVNIL